MKKGGLKLIFLVVGTTIFSFILYIIVLSEKDLAAQKKDGVYIQYHYRTKDKTLVYSKPDNKSFVIARLDKNMKIKTLSETKYYFEVTDFEYDKQFSSGYIAKRDLIQGSRIYNYKSPLLRGLDKLLEY
jgi:hypothetical protein